MQLNPARRANKTYGKGNKNSLVYDLFNYRSSHDDSSATASSIASPAPISDVQSPPLPVDIAELPQSLSLGPGLHQSRPIISENTKHKRTHLQDAHLFDMPSSDNDTSSDTSGSRASKRRRVIDTGRDTRMAAQEYAQPVPKRMEDSVISRRKAKHMQKSRHDANRISKAPKPSLSNEKHEGSVSVRSAAFQTKTTKPALVRKPIPVQRAKRGGKPLALSRRSEDAQSADLSGTEASGNMSDHPRPSATRSKITPKRKRLSASGTDSDLSSPANLGLTALKLTTPGASPAGLSPEPSSDASTRQRRSRGRLIDRLDAPSHSVGATSEDQLSDVPARSTSAAKKETDKTRIKSNQEERKGNRRQLQVTSTESLQESQQRTNWTAKPRTTYATQRSHLSDMVTDLDGLDNPSSQKSANEFLLQISASNIPSQLELDDESDDSAGGGKLKSIHELRQAGVNNRFERELDALLEDIDAGRTASKALRLQALIKLADKLQDPSFARHIATGGRIVRLTAISAQQLDLPTSILLTASYKALAETETISSTTLGQLFKAATDLAPSMLQDERLLSEIVKDRKQNLSRALIHDLQEFARGSGSLKESSGVPHKHSSDSIALTCLEHILRRLVKLGDTSARLSTSVYAKILRSLSSQVRHLTDDVDKPVDLFKLETTLSLLELCSFCVDDADLHIADNEYETLGNTLAEIIYKTEERSDSLDGNVLRVVVSLSNNRPRMCRLLGNTAISKANFSIIDKNFLSLAKQADDGGALDEKKLDSVVLALGCLLNFAECDSNLRVRLSKRNADDENYIAQLVSIFNSQVSKVDEAMTTAQTHVSVAFGYLAMLLCTLSLHPAIKAQVTQLLSNKSFDELCGAAEKFFSHLRTLEHISEDDAAMSTFTARFSVILETVRAL